MRVIIFSLDPKIADPNSSARARMREYGELLDELAVIVLAKSVDSKRIQYGKLTIYTSGKEDKWSIKSWAQKLGVEIVRDFKDKGETVISAQDPFFVGYIAYKVAKKVGVPLQLQLHTDIFSRAYKKESIKNRINCVLARHLLPKAQSIRVVSERMKELLASDSRFQIPDSKISVLPVFVDTEHFKNAVPQFDLRKKYHQFDKIILWVGRLTHEKNPALAIEIFSKVSEKFPKAGLIIVGDGPERKNLETRILNLESLHPTPYTLRPHIIFAGWQNDLIPYYKGADALSVTSLYEGYGMQIIEALASGCPVVSTDVGIARESGALIADEVRGQIELLSGILEMPKQVKLNPVFLLCKKEYLSQMKDSLRACVR